MTTFVEEYRTAFGLMLKLIFESILYRTRGFNNACPPSLRSGGQKYNTFRTDCASIRRNFQNLRQSQVCKKYRKYKEFRNFLEQIKTPVKKFFRFFMFLTGVLSILSIQPFFHYRCRIFFII